MLQIIGLVWPLIVIGSPAAVTTAHVDFQQTYSGSAQGVVVDDAAGVAGGFTMTATVAASDKPITFPSPPTVATQRPPPRTTTLLPSGPNIIPNVYFPIGELNKNLISTNDSPGSSGSGTGATTTYNNNNNRGRSQQNQKLDALNDLRPESDLINTASRSSSAAGGGLRQSLHYYQSEPDGKRGSDPIISKRGSGGGGVGTTNVTTQLNSHAYLNCKLNRTLLQISQVSNKSVSWVRVRDDHILTVNRVTFIGDERFQSFYDAVNGAWSLQIKYVQEEDDGVYECQVSTEPKVSAQVHLNVVVPKTEMIGEPIRFVKIGSHVMLRCIVRDSLEPPIYMSWFYNSHQIYNENVQGWRLTFDRNIMPSLDGTNKALSSDGTPFGSILPSATGAISSGFYHSSSTRFKSIGSLIIPSVQKRDTGNYTCSPSNSGSVTVMLHVIQGDYSASAITSSCSRGRFSDLITIIISVAMLSTT